MALELKAKVSLDGSGYEAGLRNLKTKTGEFTNFIGGLKGKLAAAFGIGAITQATRKTLQFAGNIRDLSDRLGISTDAIQEFDFAASQSGSSIEQVAKAIQHLAKSQAAALAQPKGDVAKAFANIGLSFDELKTFNPEQLEQLFRRVAAAIEQSSSPASHLADIMKILGQSGAELIPVFVNGFSTIAQQIQEMGAIVEEDVIDRLDNIGDAFDRLAIRSRSAMARAFDFASRNARIAAALIAGAFSDDPRQFGADLRKQLEGEAGQAAATRERRRRQRENIIIPEIPAIGGNVKASRALLTGISRANELQRIGALVQSHNPVVPLTKQVIRILQLVERNTRKTNIPSIFG